MCIEMGAKTRQLVKQVKLRLPKIPQKPKYVPEHMKPKLPYRKARQLKSTNPFVPGPDTEAAVKDRIRYWNIAIGDRVQVSRGQDKDKVGVVAEIFRKHNQLRVQGLNVQRKLLPPHMRSTERPEERSVEYPMPIHYSNLRLAGRIPGEDGKPKDIVAKRIKRGQLFFNKATKMLTWRRWIPGERFFLPWPLLKPSTEAANEEVDSLAADVAAETFTPTLHQAPFPAAIIDELRFKYSKLRARKSVRRRLLNELSPVAPPVPVESSADPNVLQTGDELKKINKLARRERKKNPSVIKEGLLIEIGKKMAEKGFRPGQAT